MLMLKRQKIIHIMVFQKVKVLTFRVYVILINYIF